MFLAECFAAVRTVLSGFGGYLQLLEPAGETVPVEQMVAVGDSDELCPIDHAETDDAVLGRNEVQARLVAGPCIHDLVRNHHRKVSLYFCCGEVGVSMGIGRHKLPRLHPKFAPLPHDVDDTDDERDKNSDS